MINYDYLSCTDYNGTTKMLDMFPSTPPAIKDTTVAVVSTDNSDSTLVHMHKASAASSEFVMGDGTGLTIEKLFLAMHPVGSIFMTTDSRNPGEIYGGTWTAWGSGRVPVGVNSADEDFNVTDKVGGSKEGVAAHTHSLSPFTVTTESGGRHYHAIRTRVATSKTSIENAYSPWTPVEDGEYPYLVFGYDNNTTAVSINNNIATEIQTNTTRYLTTDFDILANGAHTHTVNITGRATYSTGDKNGNLQPYITCYMWKRIA